MREKGAWWLEWNCGGGGSFCARRDGRLGEGVRDCQVREVRREGLLEEAELGVVFNREVLCFRWSGGVGAGVLLGIRVRIDDENE